MPSAQVDQPNLRSRAEYDKSIPPGQRAIDLRGVGRHVVVARVELARQLPQILREQVGIEDLAEPPQPDQAVHRRREVDPAERQLGGEMYAPRAHSGDRRPGRIPEHRRGEILVDGDDDVRIPKKHLLEGDVCKAATRATGDVLREELDRLHVDRAAEAGLEPARPARVIDARTALRRDGADAPRDGLDRVFGVARKRLTLLATADQVTERAIGERNAVEAAVEQRVGDAGLLLHAVGERDIGRIDAADVENEIGLEREYDLEIGGVAAPGDATHFRPAADVGQEEFALLRPIGARPAEETLGGERIEKARRRWSRRKNALDPRRYRDAAAGAVGDRGRARTPRREHRGCELNEQRAAIEDHVAPISLDLIMAAGTGRRSHVAPARA